MRAVRFAVAIAALLASAPASAADDVSSKSKSVKIEGGYEIGAMFARPMHGGRLRVGYGFQTDTRGFWAVLSGRYGASFVSVPTWDVRIGIDSELVRLGIFHAGAGTDLGVLGFTSLGERDPAGVTGPGARVALSLGVSGRAGIDVVRFDDSPRSALTLDLRIDGHVFPWGYYAAGALLAGARF